MNERMTANELLGRLVFALADDDPTALRVALADIAASRDPLAVLIAAATSVRDLMKELGGDDWRDVLNLAMLQVSVEEVPNGDA